MKLVIKQGPNSGQEVELEGSTVVGRDPANASFVIDDPEASRRHASIAPGDSGATVEDLGSTNGTFLNGQRVEGVQQVGPGDEIRIGNTVLEVTGAIDVTQMSPIPETADPDATAIGVAVPDEPPPAPPEPEHPAPVEPEPPAAPAYEPEPAVAHSDPAPAGDFGSAPPPPPAYEEPTETVPPDPVPAAPQADWGSPPPPPAPPSAGGPPPPGAGQGFGSPQQGYAQPPAPYMGQPGGPMVPSGYGPMGGGMETRDPTRTWLLCALVPFYALIHFHRTNKEMEAWSGGRIQYNAGASLTAFILGGFAFGIPIFVAIASYMGRVRTAQQMAGLQPQANFWGFLGRNLLLSYGWKWLQDQFNEIAVRQPQG